MTLISPTMILGIVGYVLYSLHDYPMYYTLEWEQVGVSYAPLFEGSRV
jgi:hypothetical protein